MADSDFEQPLGLTDQRSSRLANVPYRLIAFTGLGIVGLALFTFITMTGDPMGGEPYAIAVIHEEKAPEKPPSNAVAVSPPTDTTGSVPKHLSTAEELEQKSGVTVMRAGTTVPNALIITVPPDLGVHLAPAPDSRLTEKTRYGLIPRIGGDGARPAEVYARPVVSAAALPPNAPRLALLIGGMGLDAAATAKAVQVLPGAVTLGFAPYGRDLDRQVAAARDQGHEIVLQLPMEPFDYPKVNPGPHSLLTSAAEGGDDLHWLMARFSGYAGVANFLGAKFTSDEAALAPILREVAARGLYFADDGTSAQSLAPTLAPGLGLDLAKADVVLGGSSKADGLAADLLQLEAKARDKGIAVGIASGLTLDHVERIARFAQTLEARGIALVPLSALVGKDKGRSLVRREP